MTWVRTAVACLTAIVVLLVSATPALARGATRISTSLPRAALVNAQVVVAGEVRGAGSVAILQRLGGGRWISVGRAVVGRSRTFAIVWRAPGRAQLTRLRVVV